MNKITNRTGYLAQRLEDEIDNLERMAQQAGKIAKDRTEQAENGYPCSDIGVRKFKDMQVALNYAACNLRPTTKLLREVEKM